MYALINLAKVKNVRSGKFYETIPDGRSIVPLSDLRAFGTLENVDIIASATELKQLIERQKEQGLISGIPLEDTAVQNGGKNPEDTQTDDTVTDGTVSGEENPETGGMQEILPPAEESLEEEEIMPAGGEQKPMEGGKL